LVDISQRFCREPWITADVYQNGDVFFCCPSWIYSKPMGNLLEQPWDEIWNGPLARKARQSMLDSTFDCCIAKRCPSLLAENIERAPVYEKSDMNSLWEVWGKVKPLKKYYENRETYDPIGPTIVILSYDQSCNLQCPTCRSDLIMHTPKSKTYKDLLKVHKIVTEVVCKDADQITVAGSGDAFGSPLHREFMRTLNPTDYPNLEFIRPMTNALLWNKPMWDSMKAVHPFVKGCYISIDAATSETYNKVRTIKSSHGNFEQLIENLKFINTIPNITDVTLAFVISHLNYFEVEKFLDMKKYFPDKEVSFIYYKVLKWNHFWTENSDFPDFAVWDKSHPKYESFLKYWKRCLKRAKDDNIYLLHTLHGI
jgi:MoaA/NifB/PqqE/SkfB family radical SAM enzyme